MKLFEKRYHPPGTGPGTLEVAEKIPEDAYRIHLIDYTADSFQENDNAAQSGCPRGSFVSCLVAAALGR